MPVITVRECAICGSLKKVSELYYSVGYLVYRYNEGSGVPVGREESLEVCSAECVKRAFDEVIKACSVGGIIS